MDGITKAQYGQDLQDKLRDLHERLKTKRYRHQAIRRVHIPKEKKGQTRPIGISATEVKVMQNALREVLEAVYELTFMGCSHGFRPGGWAHDAIRALTRAVDEGEANWMFEFDVVSFFDSLRRSQLLEMLQERMADRSLLRLIGKCLYVGVLDGEELSELSEGRSRDRLCRHYSAAFICILCQFGGLSRKSGRGCVARPRLSASPMTVSSDLNARMTRNGCGRF